MRTTSLSLCLLAFGAALAGPGLAAEPRKDAADVAGTLQKTLEARYPQVKVLEIRRSAIDGLYEVYTEDSIVYADASGDHLLRGPLMDTRTGRNLTADRQDERDSIDFPSLPFAQAIKTVKGDGSRQMAVFADPDCPFCQQLEQELASVDNVTVYVFLYPLDIHPGAAERARAIWCSEDRSQVWTQWMREKKTTPTAECDSNPVAQLHELGQTLRVGSTPTIFFASGRRVTGSIPATKIDGYLLEKPNSMRTPPKTAQSRFRRNAG